MHISRIVFLLLLLLASASYGQAAIPMVPARPPMVRPVTNAPAFPTPGHTPAGAGLPGERVPGSGDVQRSPNKRILPASKEPGLWAADGAPVASSAPAPLFNVPLPYPVPEWGLGARLLMDRCIQSVTAAAEQVGKREAMEAIPESARRCLAAIHIFACGHDEALRLIEAARDGAPVTDDEIKSAANLQAHGRQMRDSLCAGAGVTPQHQTIFDAILKRWMSNEYNGKTSQSTH